MLTSFSYWEGVFSTTARIFLSKSYLPDLTKPSPPARVISQNAHSFEVQAQREMLSLLLSGALCSRGKIIVPRGPFIPLIEYGARDRYVLISPDEGELPITPDSPEWFAWLASLSSFRFMGRQGRFSARRGYNHRPNRGWYAQRSIHQKNYSKYIGVSEHVTTERLEQVAAHFQSYLP